MSGKNKTYKSINAFRKAYFPKKYRQEFMDKLTPGELFIRSLRIELRKYRKNKRELN